MGRSKFATYLANNHQKIVNIVSVFSYMVAIPATIIGIWFTYYSIKNTAEVVEKQLKEQKKATSVIIVGDFLSELSTKFTSKTDSDDQNFDKVIITRTQLLIDTLDFPDLIAQVIVFLGANDFGYLFDTQRKSEDKFIELANIELENAVLGNIKITSPNFYCSDLRNSSQHGSTFIRASFNLSNLESSQLIGTQFNDSTFDWTNLKNSYVPAINFSGSRIIFSNLMGIKSFKGSTIPRKEEIKIISNNLMKAKSLYGSIIDEDIKDYIIEQGREDLFNNIEWASNIDKESEHFNDISEIYQKNKSLAANHWEEEWSKRRKRNCKI